MKKETKIILILLFCIIAILLVDLFILFVKKENVIVHYSCIGRSAELEQENDDYLLISLYDFSFENKKVIQSQMEQIFLFKNQESYDHFSYQNFSDNEILEMKEMPEILEKNYIINKTISNDKKSLKKYLDLLKNNGYECETSSEE